MVQREGYKEKAKVRATRFCAKGQALRWLGSTVICVAIPFRSSCSIILGGIGWTAPVDFRKLSTNAVGCVGARHCPYQFDFKLLGPVFYVPNGSTGSTEKREWVRRQRQTAVATAPSPTTSIADQAPLHEDLARVEYRRTEQPRSNRRRRDNDNNSQIQHSKSLIWLNSTIANPQHRQLRWTSLFAEWKGSQLLTYLCGYP